MIDKFNEYIQSYFTEKGYTNDQTNKPENLKFVIYARKSSIGKDKQEKSIGDQLKYCDEYADSKGLHVVDRLTEEGTAKKSGGRDVFYEMLSNIRKGKYNAILTWHPDRLARNMKDAGEVIDMLDTGLIKDIKFVSYVFENDANGKLALGIQFVLAKSYSDNLSVNTRRGNEARIVEGKGLKSDKYGYILDEFKHYMPDGRNFELIKGMFKKVLANESLKAIAEWFNLEGLTLNGKKHKYSFQFVSRLLANPFYAGFNITSRQTIDLREWGFQEAVSQEDFILARERLGHKFNFDRKDIKVTVLRGLVQCAFCSHTMYAYKGRGGHGGKYLYLRCSNPNCIRKTESNHKIQIRSKIVFDFASNVVKGCKFTRELYDKLIKKIDTDAIKKLPKLQNRIRLIQKDIKQIKTSISDKEKTRSSMTELVIVESITSEIAEKYLTINQKETEIQKIEEEAERIKEASKFQTIKYEKLANLIENAYKTIKSSKKQQRVTDMMNLMFANLTADDSKVVSYKLREPFATYLILNNSHNG